MHNKSFYPRKDAQEKLQRQEDIGHSRHLDVLIFLFISLIYRAQPSETPHIPSQSTPSPGCILELNNRISSPLAPKFVFTLPNRQTR